MGRGRYTVPDPKCRRPPQICRQLAIPDMPSPQGVDGSGLQGEHLAGVVTIDYPKPSFNSAMAVRKGTNLVIISTADSMWWKVRTTSGTSCGQVGFVPAKFCGSAAHV